MTANNSSTRRPSDAEWAAHLPRICDLYYGQRCTLEDTQRILQEEADFHATLRMYKDRIRSMAVHPKKICMQKYQAMNVIAEDYQQRGVGVFFTGPSGFQLFKRTPAQITKQLRRPHCLPPISLDEAKEVLRQANINAIVEHNVTRGYPNFHNTDTFAHETYQASAQPLPHSFPHPQEAASSWDSSSWPEDGPSPELSRKSSLAEIQAHEQLTLPPLLINNMTQYSPTDQQSPCSRAKPGTISLAGINLMPDRLMLHRSRDGEDDSYDFVDDFDALSMNGSSSSATPPVLTPGGCRTLPPPTATMRRRMATESAAPFFLACFRMNGPHTMDFSRAVAMEKFKYILTTTPENQFVLPLLNWMSTVLSANGKRDQLKDFVSECCQVLDSCREYGFPLATPYRYMLAFCNEDDAARALHGQHFATGTERLIQLYGPDHPNVLVNEYYRAWHELAQPNGWDSARTILESCRIKSERVMGRHNLMTINCLAVLGRGFSENGLCEHAQSTFEDIIERLGTPAPPLQAYKLLIVERLAAELEQAGDLRSAEVQYRQVYEGRLHCLSASNPETLMSKCTLTRLLRDDGRRGEASDIERRYDQMLQHGDTAVRQDGSCRPSDLDPHRPQHVAPLGSVGGY